jgi:hypothetical protein
MPKFVTLWQFAPHFEVRLNPDQEVDEPSLITSLFIFVNAIPSKSIFAWWNGEKCDMK